MAAGRHSEFRAHGRDRLIVGGRPGSRRVPRGRRRAAPAGLERAIVAPVFGRLHVVPRLREFFTRYPGIAVELLMSERLVNLIEDGVDVAIHNGELKDSSLISRKFAATPVITVATPNYLAKHGLAACPVDLDPMNRHRELAHTLDRRLQRFLHPPLLLRVILRQAIGGLRLQG